MAFWFLLKKCCLLLLCSFCCHQGIKSKKIRFQPESQLHLHCNRKSSAVLCRRVQLMKALQISSSRWEHSFSLRRMFWQSKQISWYVRRLAKHMSKKKKMSVRLLQRYFTRLWDNVLEHTEYHKKIHSFQFWFQGRVTFKATRRTPRDKN